jgi:hypothetical protein
MMSTASKRTRSVRQLLEEVQRAGFRLIVHSDAASLCCASGDRSAVQVLIEQRAMPSLLEFLEGFGFFQMFSCAVSESASVATLIGYCESCTTLTQLDISAVVTVGRVSDNELVFLNADRLFAMHGGVRAPEMASAIEAITRVCAASMQQEYRVRTKKRLMAQARARYEECTGDSFQAVSQVLVGTEAAKFVAKLVEIDVAWEVDLLLQSLRRELAEADGVALSPSRSWQFPTRKKNHRKHRLTDKDGRVQSAPVVVITHAEADKNATQSVAQLFSNNLVCRLVELGGVSIGTTATERLNKKMLSLWQRTSFASDAIGAALRRYFRWRKARALAAKGMPVIIPDTRFGDSPGAFSFPVLNHWSSTGFVLRLSAAIEHFLYGQTASPQADRLIIVDAGHASTGADSGAARHTQAKDALPAATDPQMTEGSSPPEEVKAQLIRRVLLALSNNIQTPKARN